MLHPRTVGPQCRGPRRSVDSLAVWSSTTYPEGRDGVGLAPDGEVGGHAVSTSHQCFANAPTSACTWVWSVPDLDAHFALDLHRGDDAGIDTALATRMRDSLVVLDEDWVVVPVLPADAAGVPETRLASIVAALREVGLVPVVKEWECPPNASCVAGASVEAPATGRVVRVGTRVRVSHLAP